MRLREHVEDFYVFQRNGTDMICSIVPPIIIGAPYGEEGKQQVQLQKSFCSSLCPLFKIHNDGESISLNCGVGVEYKIEDVITQEEQKKADNIPKMFTMNKMGEA